MLATRQRKAAMTAQTTVTLTFVDHCYPALDKDFLKLSFSYKIFAKCP
jgi:hypothetical protein